MSGVYQFLKSTMVGGLVVLVPLFALLAVLGWAANIALAVIMPLFEWLPDKSVGGVSITVLAAIGSLIGGCFLIGLFAETAVVRFLGTSAERLALSVPGYALMKNVGASFVGLEGKNPVRTVLVQFVASWQLGFVMETLPDGRYVVFVPGVPRALVGTLHIVAADRVQFLAMSVPAALDALGRLGVGLGDMRVKEPDSTSVPRQPAAADASVVAGAQPQGGQP
jgi:uncharacterized membrane protein